MEVGFLMKWDRDLQIIEIPYSVSCGESERYSASSEVGGTGQPTMGGLKRREKEGPCTNKISRLWWF